MLDLSKMSTPALKAFIILFFQLVTGNVVCQTLAPKFLINPGNDILKKRSGIISGTPTVLRSLADSITAYNGGESSITTVSVAVGVAPVLMPSVITMPFPQPDVLDANNNYDPGATSTNPEAPITYTSSNTSVAVVTPEGLIHVIGPGVTIITAYQEGNANYADAVPVQQTLTVVQYLHVDLPEIAEKTVCDADFSANASTSVTAVPLTYSSSNPAVATISAQGIIHITGAGATTITVSQNTSSPLYVSAAPQSKTLTVMLPLVPEISIAAQYSGPCAGSEIRFIAAVNNGGASPVYQWKVNGNNAGTNAAIFASSTLVDGDVITCMCTNTDDVCIAGFPSASNPVEVNLITPSDPEVSITASVNSVFPGIPITLTASVSNAGGTLNYQWKVNGNNAGSNHPVFTSDSFTDGDIVTCTVTPVADCSLPATSQPVEINIVTKLEIPNTFTPNGDGINDTWNISGIASYPDCMVTIYNRYGIPVHRSKGYHQAWDGTVNGSQVPVSTYYYIIDLGTDSKKLSGAITVIR